MSTAISPTLPDQCTFWHLAFVAHGSFWFGATLPIAFDGWVSIPFSSTGREIQIGYNLQKWLFGGRSSFAP